MSIYEYLSSELSLSGAKINQVARTAPLRYKVYTIPKRTFGERTIAHPAKVLKVIQRVLIRYFEDRLPVHEAACAYKKGSSIKKNAAVHMKSKYLLKMDFLNFFHSVSSSLFFEKLDGIDFKYTNEERYLLNRVLFWSPSKRLGGKLILSIGAPSSPLISNFIMYDFDCALHEACSEKGIKYTRYADDITFSTNSTGTLFLVPSLVRRLLKLHTNGKISVNESKTIFSSKAHNRHVTGITLANNGRLSIGRERKRLISSMLYRFKMGSLSSEDVPTLQGLLAFAFNIEPAFKASMVRKYSLISVESALKGQQ